jgi:hypothetical protein
MITLIWPIRIEISNDHVDLHGAFWGPQFQPNACCHAVPSARLGRTQVFPTFYFAAGCDGCTPCWSPPVLDCGVGFLSTFGFLSIGWLLTLSD